MPQDQDRETEVLRFRAAQDARAVYILTLITPLRAALDRFVVVATDSGAQMAACINCRLNAPLHLDGSAPLDAATWDAFQRGLASAAGAWDADAVASDVLDGLTIIAERADASGYAITHILAPRGNTPHARLVRLWRDTFPAVARALRG